MKQLPPEVAAICEQWRKRYPDRQHLTNEQIIEVMLLNLCVHRPDRFSKEINRDGEVVFTIKPPPRADRN